MNPLVRTLESAALSPLDRHFARSMARLAREERPEVVLAAALASRAVARGHVALDLAHWAQAGAASTAGAEEGIRSSETGLPPLEDWLAMLGESPLVEKLGADDAGEAGEESESARPLVLDAQGLLYLRRYWVYQQRLAAELQRRASSAPEPLDEALLERGLARLFGPADAAAFAAQREAAARALRRRLCIVSGGPGTGKTTTVVRILALIVEEHLARAGRPPLIELVAPTGKAAARLEESIRRQRDELDCDEKVRAALPARARTLHRCLGLSRGRRFRHDAAHPLACDLMVLDEASMVDLSLMAHLSSALPARARLLLLGDRDQLLSVEAGSVLRDLCAATEPRGGLQGCGVHLTHSHRYASQSGVGELAAAVLRGEADAVLGLLEDDRYPELALHPPGAAGERSGSRLEALVREGLSDYLAARGPLEHLRALERFRVLCAHREGRSGVVGLNRRIEGWLARSGALAPQPGHYARRPLLVTRNDAALDLCNGDVGILLPAAQDADSDPGAGPKGTAAREFDDSEGASLRAFFPAAQGGVRAVSWLRLPEVETAFAMSVHKSQGSEFDSLVLVLPERVSPLLSRELIYTAVSRARERVAIFASREVLAAAVERRVERASGLRAALAAAAARSQP